MKMLDVMPARHPVNATLELTLRCNLKCKMCMFRHSDRENACLAAEELTSSQWADMAQQLFDAGTLNILITGGEPLLRKDSARVSPWRDQTVSSATMAALCPCETARMSAPQRRSKPRSTSTSYSLDADT